MEVLIGIKKSIITLYVHYKNVYGCLPGVLESFTIRDHKVHGKKEYLLSYEVTKIFFYRILTQK